MIPSPPLRSLLPGQNPLNFSGADFVFLGLAALLVFAFVAGSRIAEFGTALSRHPRICAGLLFVAPIVLRLTLLGQHPVPVPRVADDFSYLLLGDTLAHFRLANATHPMHRFFEAVFVLQEPSYSSIYPLGQGIVLAAGQLVFHLPWAGVLISAGLLSALCYWMLRAWVPPGWALLGGFLAALQFGPLSVWTNNYWGGLVPAIAGCLIFGGICRTGLWPTLFLGLGLGLQLVTRPYEFVLLLPALFLLRPPRRTLAIAALVLLPAAGLMLFQNKQVTGNWLTLPYQLSRYQYGIPTTFTTQPNPVPHRALTAEQQVDYGEQIAVHGPGTDTIQAYFRRLITRIRFYRFFYFPALWLALPMLVFGLRDRRIIAALITLTILCIGDAFYPYFYPHYIAAATCLFVLFAVEALRALSRFRMGPQLVAVVLALCVAHFIFDLSSAGANDYWNGLNVPDPENRASIERTLEDSPGAHLVFVRYSRYQHREQEWIHNRADIDGSRTIWAVDLGDEENATLRRYYPNRDAWLFEPDARPARLAPLSPR
jgi:hypothetical protein